MKIYIFDLKEMMNREGINMFDFLENNFKVSFDPINIQIDRVFMINEFHLARPDSLSIAAYGTDNHVDILLKFNGISNPFSMDLGDIIIVPELNDALLKYIKIKPKQTIIKDTKSLYIDPSKASTHDINRLNMLSKIAAVTKNGASEIKPTNLLRKDETPFTTDGTVILLAPSISKK